MIASEFLMSIFIACLYKFSVCDLVHSNLPVLIYHENRIMVSDEDYTVVTKELFQEFLYEDSLASRDFSPLFLKK